MTVASMHLGVWSWSRQSPESPNWMSEWERKVIQAILSVAWLLAWHCSWQNQQIFVIC